MPSHAQARMSCTIILRSCPIALRPAQMQHAADVLCCLSHCDGMRCIGVGDGRSCPVLERQQGDSWPWWCRRGRGWSVVADSHAHCLTWTRASLECSHCRAAGAAAAVAMKPIPRFSHVRRSYGPERCWPSMSRAAASSC